MRAKKKILIYEKEKTDESGRKTKLYVFTLNKVKKIKCFYNFTASVEPIFIEFFVVLLPQTAR